jgi:thioredoxin-related protein
MGAMNKLVLLLAALLPLASLQAQEARQKLYDPSASAAQDIQKGLKQAAMENKYVMIQAGGNWCSWCYKFDQFCREDAQVDSSLKAAYVIVHLNFSKENYNQDLFRDLGYPQRFGFPVFIILDANGKQIHTQNSALLEKEKSYDRDKVLGFIWDWSPGAFEPSKYKINHP